MKILGAFIAIMLAFGFIGLSQNGWSTACGEPGHRVACQVN